MLLKSAKPEAQSAYVFMHNKICSITWYLWGQVAYLPAIRKTAFCKDASPSVALLLEKAVYQLLTCRRLNSEDKLWWASL